MAFTNPASRLRTAGTAVLIALLAASLLPLPTAARGPLPVEGGIGAASTAGTADAARAQVAAAPAGLDATSRDRAAAFRATLPAGVTPSAMYEQALAHAADRIDFTPGDRVTIPFTPRADDRWPVGGAAPVRLPAGRATGEAMADAGEGSTWAAPADGVADPTPIPSAAPDGGPVATADPVATDTPTDVPSNDGAAAIAATGAGWTATPLAPAGTPSAATGLRRQVFGFLPYWEVSGATSKLNFDVLSTIAYFSVGVDSRGNLRKQEADGSLTTGWAGWTSSSMTSVIQTAHARGTRVVLTVSAFAWSTATATVQKNLLGSATARANLAKQIAAAVRDRGADGVNLDFEPISTGYEAEFTALIKAIRVELNAIKTGYQITFDTTGWIGNYPLETALATGAADAVFIMGYDYRTSGAAVAGSTDPLTGTGYDLTDTVRAYTSRVAASKVILGLPWYGRAWSTVSNTARSTNQSGLKYGYSTAVNYETVVDLVAQYGRSWDAAEQSPFVAYQRENCTSTYGCVTSWRQVYYDDYDSTKLRLALVNTYALRGAGMWALGYDGGHSELYRAFAESFLVDKSAPQAGITLLAPVQGDEGFTVTWSATDESVIASYDVQVSVDGGDWTDWLLATTATSALYQGADGHGYAFRVRARDSRGNAGAWNVTSTWTASPTMAAGGFAKVLVDGLAYRTGPGTSAAKVGTLVKGTVVALTRGPVAADGYTWWEVTQPVQEWSTVSFVERGVWVASASATTTYLAATKAPNSTRVDAGIAALDFGTATAAAAGLGDGPDALAARTFSPNGDGSDDSLRIKWVNGVTLDTLTLNAYRLDGTLAGTAAVGATAVGAHAWTWNGRFNGTLLADGQYLLQLVGAVGTTTYSAPSASPADPLTAPAYVITVDTAAPVITASTATGTVLSPNGDGRSDTLTATVATADAVRWAASVAAEAGGLTLRTATGTGPVAQLAWDGQTDAAAASPDGAYTITIDTWDLAGNRATRTFPVRIDTLAPTVTPATSRTAFSPNGDGTADTVALSFASTEPGTGVARVYRGTTLVRSWSVNAATAWSAAWDGRTAAGAAVADGVYTFKVGVRDAAGNLTWAASDVTVDRAGGWLRWSGAFFPQDRDGLAATSTLSYRLTTGATTTLVITDATGAVVATPWTARAQAAGTRTFTWDGRRADGTLVPQGRYTARLTVVSALGTAELTRTVVAAAYAITTAPAATAAAGGTVRLAFTKVEALATRPVLTFTQAGLAGVTITATRLADGSYTAAFKVAAGAPGPATIRITARDAAGHTNSMTLTVTILP